MNDFFRSVRFKVLVAILAVMAGFMIMSAYSGGTAPLFAQIIHIVTTPVQRFSTNIANGVTGFFDKYLQAGQTYEQNRQLQAEINELREKLIDYEAVKHENEQFREIIGVIEQSPGRKYKTASVIARQPEDPFSSFSIDKGLLDGISPLDPVITADGLVGYVSEVSATSSRVVTLLNVAVKVGAYNGSTRDIGIVTGTVELAEQGLCRVEYLPLDSQSKAGDYILTSGGELFPKDIPIGEIVDVQIGLGGISRAATIRPFAKIESVKDVFVIIEFGGQGGAASP